MATQLIDRTVNSLIDSRVRLTNSELFRVMNIGNNWTTLRLGIRLSMVPDSDTLNINGTPRFYFGLSSGQSNGIGAETPSHFLGIVSNTTAWKYNSSPVEFYSKTSVTDGIDFHIISNIDGTETIGTKIRGCSISSIGNDLRSAIFIEINKGAPNFTVQIYGPKDTGAQMDITIPEFIEIMGQETMNLLDANTHYALGTSQTTAIDEASDGLLDTINVYWDRFTQRVEVCDIAYSKRS